jgi:hypothetical protein
MTATFYETLLVPPEADEQLLQHSYEQTLSALSKRLRAARQRGLETAVLEQERQALEEAWRVLSDPVRRARYDSFLRLAGERPAQEADELWAQVSPALLDPAADATLDLVRLLTRLPVGEPARRASAPALAPPPARVPRPAVRAAPTPAPPPPAVRPAATKPAPPPAKPAPTPEPAPPGTGAAVIALPRPAAAPAPKPAADDLASLVFELGYSGALIKRLREAKGMSIEDVASSTRIARRYLEAIEADEFARLPAATFVRGYLRSLARLLEVDPERLSGGYLTRMGR